MAGPFATIQTAFNNGEITPRLRGHIDLQKFQSSLAQMINVNCLKHGGAQRRSGWRYVAATKFPDKKARLIPFQFNIVQNYVIELGHLYMRFYSNQGVVLAGGGPAVFEVATPWTEDELAELSFTQSADIMYFAHKNHRPRVLKRLAPNDFTLDFYNFVDGPYLEIQNDPNHTLELTHTGGSNFTITVASGPAVFASTDVDRLVRFDPQGGGGNPFSFKITNYNSPTSVNVVHQSEFRDDSDAQSQSGQGSRYWRLGAWSDTTTWPAVVTFHQERIWWAGGGGEEAQTVNGSESGDFEKFSPTNDKDEVLDSSGIRYTLATDQVNAIRHMKSANVLAIFTSGAEFSMTASEDAVLSPSNVKVSRETQHGTSLVEPQYVGRAIAFVQRSGRKVRELSFDFAQNGFQAPDLTLLAEHITKSGIADMTYQQEPDTILWACLENGKALAGTIDKDQGVVGWSQQPVSGKDAKVKSLTSIPSSVENRDEPWSITELEVNGSTVQYVSFLEAEFDFEDSLEDYFGVDFGLTYEGPATNTLTGLDHLEGEEVQILANGSVRPSQTVVGGEVTIEGTAATKAHAGLGFDSVMETLPPTVNLPTGTSHGSRMRIHGATFEFYNTVGLEYGINLNDMDRLPFRNAADPMNQSVPLFSGPKEVKIPAGWEKRQGIFARQSQPLPFTVLAIVPRVTVNRGD